MRARDHYPSGWNHIAPCSFDRNSCHVCIGTILWSPLHTWHHMGGSLMDPRIRRQGHHYCPGSLQTPYKCSKNISHKGAEHIQLFLSVINHVFKSIPSIAYSKLSVSIFTRRYLSPVMRDGSNCTLVSSSPARNVLQDAVSFWGIKSNPDKATRQTTCFVIVTE